MWKFITFPTRKAKSAVCHKCSLKGHYARMCKNIKQVREVEDVSPEDPWSKHWRDTWRQLQYWEAMESRHYSGR